MNNHIKLILASGGLIENNIFVTKPGIVITQITKQTEEFKRISSIMNIDSERDEYEQHGEFNSRITYMSFKKDTNDSTNYNKKMVKEFQHLSVYNDHHVTFLLAGISLEACQEIVAHSEATVARLTSSKTKTQSNPLFVINNPHQKEYIKSLITLREKHLSNDVEDDNMMFPSTKAISLTVTMSLKNWHKTLIGRLSNKGVEKEVLSIMKEICELLNTEYPLVIKTPETYYEISNGEKYKK